MQDESLDCTYLHIESLCWVLSTKPSHPSAKLLTHSLNAGDAIIELANVDNLPSQGYIELSQAGSATTERIWYSSILNRKLSIAVRAANSLIWNIGDNAAAQSSGTSYRKIILGRGALQYVEVKRW